MLHNKDCSTFTCSACIHNVIQNDRSKKSQVYLLLAKDQQALWFDGMIRGQILPTAPLDSILESFPHSVAGGPGHANVMPLAIVYQKGQLCHLEYQASVSVHDQHIILKSQTSLCSYLIIDENLHRVVPPLNKDQLVGLSWDCVRERCAHSWRGVGLEPHAHSEGVHLWQAPFDFGIHVVGPEWKGKLEFIQRPVFSLTCEGQILLGLDSVD